MVKAFAYVGSLLKQFPALSAALVNVGIIVLAHFGLHLSPEQFMAVVGVAVVLFGIITHSNVTPMGKVEESAAYLVKTPVGRKLLAELEKKMADEALKAEPK